MTDLCTDCSVPVSRRAKRCAPCQRKLRGPNHGSWRGGVVNDSAGYLKEFAPDHPKANVGRYVLQHRLVMERHLGRYLEAHESVHHVNGDKHDNRIKNLELWSTSQPAGQRIEDKVKWAREILALYGEETS